MLQEFAVSFKISDWRPANKKFIKVNDLPALPKNILNFGELKVKDYVIYTKCLLNKEPLPTVLVSINTKGDDTWDDSQRRLLAQHSVAMLEQCGDHSKQCRNNVATLCCVKNLRWESSRVATPLEFY